MESIFNHSEQQKPTVSAWDRVGDLLQELNGGILLCTSAYDPAIASCDGIMGAPPTQCCLQTALDWRHSFCVWC